MNASSVESSVLLIPNQGSVRAMTCDAIARSWRWMRSQGNLLTVRQRSRRLRVSETISLGEKRFVSILEVDGEQLLIGGSAESLVLLAKLENPKRDLLTRAEQPEFSEMLSRVAHTTERSRV